MKIIEKSILTVTAGSTAHSVAIATTTATCDREVSR